MISSEPSWTSQRRCIIRPMRDGLRRQPVAGGLATACVARYSNGFRNGCDPIRRRGEEKGDGRMKRRDWTLLTIAAASRPVSPVQLQKSLFLLGQNLPKVVGSDFYSFTPYNYGPFDAAVYQDAEELERNGLLLEARVPGGWWREYSPTREGLRAAAALEREAPAGALKYLAQVVGWAQSLSFQQLVRAIYKQYPSFKANSVFRD